MISRCMAFMLQPLRTNSVASQSRSFGCEGGRPLRPKFDGLATKPLPKWFIQIRLTMTLAVRGWLGCTSQRARANRRPLDSGFALGGVILYGVSPARMTDGTPG